MRYINKPTTILQAKYNGPDSISDGSILSKKNTDIDHIGDCRIFLYDQKMKRFIKSVLSSKNGKYSFPNLNLKDFKFFIIAHHPKGELNGVIADNIGGGNVDN